MLIWSRLPLNQYLAKQCRVEIVGFARLPASIGSVGERGSRTVINTSNTTAYRSKVFTYSYNGAKIVTWRNTKAVVIAPADPALTVEVI